MTEVYIKTAADARKCLGQTVYWDDVSARYIFLRQGILDGVHGRQVSVDGEFKGFRDRPGLRSFAMGGAWKRNKEAA